MAPSTELIPLAGRTFATLEDVKAYIESRPEEEHLELQLMVSEHFLENKDKRDAELVEVYEWIQEQRAYEQCGVTEADFQERLADVATAVEIIKKTVTQTREDNVRRTLKRCRGDRGKVMEKYLYMWAKEDVGRGKHYFQRWGAILKESPSMMEAIEAVNCELWLRITSSQQGQSSDARLRTADLELALTRVRAKDYMLVKLDFTTDDMAEYAIGWGVLGLLEPVEANSMRPLRNRPTFDDEEDVPVTGSAEGYGKLGHIAKALEATLAAEVLEIPESTLQAPTLPETPNTRELRKRKQAEGGAPEGGDDDSTAGAPAPAKKRKAAAKCDCTTAAKLHLLAINDREDAASWVAALSTALDSEEDEDMPCLLHCRKAGVILELKRLGSREEYLQAFPRIVYRAEAPRALGDAIIAFETWDDFDENGEFVKYIRKARLGGALRHEADMSVKIEPSAPRLAGEGYGILQARTGMQSAAFEWITEADEGVSLAYIFEQEMEMYLYHFEHEEDGFLPVYHSLAQQLVRQDPRLHRMHVQQREDAQIEVLAVPTPLRIFVQGEDDFFLHYMGNSWMLRQEGAGVFKDLIIMANKAGRGFELEYFRPGQALAKEWVSSEQIQEDYIRLNPPTTQNFSQCVGKFTTLHAAQQPGWAKFHMYTGDVAMFEDGTPLKYQNPVVNDSMVVSSGFVPLREDERWTVTGRNTVPIRLSNVMATTLQNDLFKEVLQGKHKPNEEDGFQATVQLTGMGALSDALIGRCRWKTSGTQAYTDFWAEDGEARYIEWQIRARKQIAAAWLQTAVLEKAAFGENSFFRMKEAKDSRYSVRTIAKRAKEYRKEQQ